MGENIHEAFKCLVMELGVNDIQGYQASEIDNNALRLNVKLPKPMRDFYLDLAATPSVKNAFQEILPPSEWEIIENRLIFAWGHQGVVFWGLGKEGLSEGSDPTVDIADNSEPPEWFKEDLPVSRFMPFLFLINMTEAMFDDACYITVSEVQLDYLRAKSRFDLYDNGMRLMVIGDVIVTVMSPADDNGYQAQFYSNEPVEISKIIEQ